jgi:site-specific DNA-methyltransferase (adenine-specific)
LAAFSKRVLKPGGSLVCMTGESYLDIVFLKLSAKLKYHWTCAYMTPAGHVQVFARKVATGWKPLLWFVKGQYKGGWIHDVIRSPSATEAADDKRFHHWGQSETGMANIIEQFTDVKDLVCDPFCGGGTTGVVALRMKRNFIGIDIDAKAIETTRQRIEDDQAKT